jgi:hypothetical protein
MPARPPYSSTTTEKWLFVRRKSCRSDARSFVSGTMNAGRRRSSSFTPARPRSCIAEKRSRTWSTPTTSSSVSR